MTEQNQDKETGRYKKVWRTWRGWVLLALALLAVVVLLAVLAWTGVIDTGFGQYTPDPSITPAPPPERAKTLWDWLDLLLVPLLLALGAWLLNRAAREREHQTELERSRDAALQTYLDRVSALLRDKWRESGGGFLEANIIRAQTLTVVCQLDGGRKGLLLRFLYESGLIGRYRIGKGRQEALVDLGGADLREADLREAILCGADLIRAELGGADLRGAILREANLSGAILSGADLSGADLSGADLRNAKVTDEQLAQAKSLEGTTLPDGTKYTVVAESEPAPTEPEPEDQPGDVDYRRGRR